MAAFYNDTDEYAAQWLRNLIKRGLIPDGEVTTCSIIDLQPADLAGFTQVHLFAGIGGWPYAARLAGWPDDRPIWTGSAPCQPYSSAGKGRGKEDKRHLWPEVFRLVASERPPVFFGEQVAAAIGRGWLDGVLGDLEGEGYACRAFVLPACAVDAPHQRDRVWIVADASGGRRGGSGEGKSELAGGAQAFWSDESYRIVGADGRLRRAKSGVRLLAHGIPARVGRLRAYGNAIVPQVGAQVIAAYMESVS